MSSREFLLDKSKATTIINIDGKKFEVRSYLTKKELHQHKNLIDSFNKAKMLIESSTFEDMGRIKGFVEWMRYKLGLPSSDDIKVASFLADVTIDPLLNIKFWLSGDVSPNVTEEILLTVLVIEPAKRLAETQKFLLQQLRPRTGTNVAGMGD